MYVDGIHQRADTSPPANRFKEAPTNDGSLETYKTLCQIDIKLSALLWISLWCAMVITLLLVGMAAITHRIDHLEQPPPVKTQPQEN